MNGQFLGEPEFIDQYFWRKLRLRHILRTSNATKLKLSQERHIDKCS